MSWCHALALSAALMLPALAIGLWMGRLSKTTKDSE
jgi:hypothetical protein